MIAYGAVQKAIHGLSFATDMELLYKCIGVLSYCARKDAIARKFRVLLDRQLNELRELHVSGNPRMDAMADRTASHDVLFSFEPGSSKLHDYARKLLNLIRRPFAGVSDMEAKDTLSYRAETTMGTHLEWAWIFKNGQKLEKLAEPEAPCGKSTAGGETQAKVARQSDIQDEVQVEGQVASAWRAPEAPMLHNRRV
jgi:hypothetical protein